MKGRATILLGNKCDLIPSGATENTDSNQSNRKVTFEEGTQLAKELGIPLFYETSARTGENVQDAFSALIDENEKKEEKKKEFTCICC